MPTLRLLHSENVDALAAGLNQLMSDPVKRQYFSYHAPKVLERFGVDPIMAMWQKALKQAIA